jgi:signal transduction histidine kinase
MARALAGLYVAGASMAVLTLLLPHAGDPDELGTLLVVANAYVVGVLVYVFAGRIPRWALAAVPAIGTVYITAAAYFSNELPSPLIFFYLWVLIYSAYFFERRTAAAEIAFVGINFAVLISIREPPSGEAWWVVAMGSMVVATGLVAAMRLRGEVLVATLLRNVRERERVQREVAMHRDHLEELVAERTAALRIANSELEAFSYSVSHDLRAPLRSLDGFSQALIEDYGAELEGQGEDYLRRIRTSSQRMARLIDDMLLLSRLSRSDMSRDEVDLSRIAREVAEDLRETEPGRDVTVEVEPGLVAYADLRLVRVLIHNLIGNAWKFTSRREAATIEVARADAEADAFMVRDDGVGFDMAYSDKLFGAFQRLHSAGDFEGTGVGLATVQRIVHRHGGRVWAEAEPDSGATFYFTLPRTRTADGEQDDPAG